MFFFSFNRKALLFSGRILCGLEFGIKNKNGVYFFFLLEQSFRAGLISSYFFILPTLNSSLIDEQRSEWRIKEEENGSPSVGLGGLPGFSDFLQFLSCAFGRYQAILLPKSLQRCLASLQLALCLIGLEFVI